MTSANHNGEAATVYLHFPCFDGIVSGALTILWLGRVHGWRFDSICPVNYDAQASWLKTALPRHSCVVDFLYHPQAEVWCDHHPTTFLDPAAREKIAAGKNGFQLFDPESPSSARILWNRAKSALGRTGQLEEMVDWADKIDSAQYDDVAQALFGSEPALEISRSLAVEADSAYCELLVRALSVSSLRELAAHPEVRRRLQKADELSQEGLRRVRQEIEKQERLADYVNLRAFKVLTDDAVVNRYSAFYLRPQIQYSIGIFQSAEAVAVRVSANPWLHFRSANLGEMMRLAAASAGLDCAGGGHERVGSLRLHPDSAALADQVVAYLIKKLHGDLKSKERSQWQKAVRQ